MRVVGINTGFVETERMVTLLETRAEAELGTTPRWRELTADLPGGPKRIVLGNRDQVIDRSAVQEYAVANGIDLLITPGDHFFHGRGEKIGDLVGQALEV